MPPSAESAQRRLREFTDDVAARLVRSDLIEFPGNNVPAAKTPAEQFAWVMFLARLDGIEIHFADEH